MAYIEQNGKHYKLIEVDKALRIENINAEIASLQSEKAELENLK